MKYTTQFSIHEDLTGNYIFLLLFLISGIILILKKNKIWPFYLKIFFGWILFNILLKWQPWHSRLELPFFVISCPILAVIFVDFLNNELKVKMLVFIMLVLSIPFVLGYYPFRYGSGDMVANSNRPLTNDVLLFKKSRYERFLAESPINSSYHEIVNKLDELRINNVGLDIGSDSWEYPLWFILREKGLQVNVICISRPNALLNVNYDSKIKNDVVIYDNVLTENKFSSGEIRDKIDFGGIKMLILK